MAPSSAQDSSLRQDLSTRWSRLHQRFRGLSSQSDKSTKGSRASDPGSVINDNGPPRPDRINSPPSKSIRITDDGTQEGRDKGSLLAGRGSSPNFQDPSIISATPLDLWSVAYREAVESLGKDLDVAILKGSNIAALFEKLEAIDKDVTQESAFLRGVTYLHKLRVPLEKFKLALDVSAPLSSIEPTANIVFGVVRGVTAIAISFATADLDFAKQIGDMLQHISYIDDCDILGQKSHKEDIHKTLVVIYQKLLEFYKVAYEILMERGVKLVMKMVLETDRLPTIIQEYLKHADALHRLINKATWEIAQDIKVMLYDSESKSPETSVKLILTDIPLVSRWLGSSKTSRQSQNHGRLQEIRSDEACEFLTSHTDFVSWYTTAASQQLVILGAVGHGKSVAVAYLVDELIRKNEHQLPQPKVCYHYCRDDETGSAVHVVSVLILSLLEQLPGLKKTFYEWYKRCQASGIVDPAASGSKLGEFLTIVVKTLDRLLFIVVDGIDECDTVSRKTLLYMLNDLLQKSPRLKILLAARPEEGILEQLQDAVKINLVSDFDRDAMIVRHTVERHLSYLSVDVKALVITNLSSLAGGSAIWTSMVVELIEIRKIRALGPMSTFLKQIPLPGQLSELYHTIFSRYCSNDDENRTICATALKILAVASRPLSIQELAWAVALGAATDEIATIAVVAQSVDHQRLMDLVHPFVARLDLDDISKRQVQLTHQSVKEFILRDWPQLHGVTISAVSTSADKNEQVATLEAFVLDICVDYLLLAEVGNSNLFSDEQIAIDELPQEVDLFADTNSFQYDGGCTWETWEENMIHYDPNDRGFGQLFVYAASNWLKHFGAVSSRSLPRLAKIERVCQSGSRRLDNWIQQNCRPDCAIKARFEFDSRLYDPLSITSLYGSTDMLQGMLEHSNFETDKFRSSSVFDAADQILQWGDLTRLQILFHGRRIGSQLRNLGFFRHMIRQWLKFRARHDNWDAAFDLLNHVLAAVVQEKWGYELLCTAALLGCVPVVERLLNQSRSVTGLEAELAQGAKPIRDAILGNHTKVVELLLKEDSFQVHFQELDSHGQNFLHLASKICNPDMFRLLVVCAQWNLQQTDCQGNTPLMLIVRSSSDLGDRNRSAQILLLSQLDADRGMPSGDEQHDPLQEAVRQGDISMCQILISDGKMDPRSVLTRDKHGDVVLKSKPREREEDTLRLLRAYIAGE